MLSFTIGKSSISLFLDGQFYSIDDSHPNYRLIREELGKPAEERDIGNIRNNITVKVYIERLTSGKVTVFDDSVVYDGQPIDNYMTRRMLELLAEGFDITPWARFMDNVFQNPAEYARGELYEWMEKAEMPMTEDGCFLAFKKIRGDYTDCHTGKFDHSPGSVVEMPREKCDPIRTNHCSTGFHFCSVGYLSQFGGQRIVVVKINPRDVTSIPNDYHFTKGRCCRYEVVAELTNQSAAYDKCWRKGVVNLEDPSEFPADVLASIKLPTPVLNEPIEITEAYEAGQQTIVLKVDASEAVAQIKEAVAQIEEDMTDANKANPGASRIPTPEQLEIAAKQKTERGSKSKKTEEPLELKAEDIVFTTAAGKTYTAKQIEDAIKDAGATRAAAALLEIAESTLRGWKKKLGL